MDRRQQKTRQAIFAAFSSLLEKKSYNNITVQEIIDEANIGRSTFYAHFETKDELLRSMCTDIFHHVFSPALKQEKNHDFSSDNHGLEKKLTHILYHLQENRRNLKGILSGESGELFMKFFKQYLWDMFSDYMEPDTSHFAEDFLLNHAVCSFAETVRWWIGGHPDFTPEEISGLFLTAVPFLVTDPNRDAKC